MKRTYEYEGSSNELSPMEKLLVVLKEMQEDIKILYKNQEMLQSNDQKLADNMAEIGEVLALMNEDIHDVARKAKKKKGA
jgi:hypothetical protein